MATSDGIIVSAHTSNTIDYLILKITNLIYKHCKYTNINSNTNIYIVSIIIQIAE